MIKIISESSIAAGIRRIEAITGPQVERMINETADTLRSIAAMFNNAPDLIATLKKSIEENHELRRQAEEHVAERIAALAKEMVEKAQHTASGITLVTMNGPRIPDVVKGVAFKVRELSPTATAFIGATVDAANKPLLTVMLTDDVVATGLKASDIVRSAAKAIKGGGGGQPGFAQAGGKDAEGLQTAFQSMIDAVK